jgi:hypothetical protein
MGSRRDKAPNNQRTRTTTVAKDETHISERQDLKAQQRIQKTTISRKVNLAPDQCSRHLKKIQDIFTSY